MKHYVESKFQVPNLSKYIDDILNYKELDERGNISEEQAAQNLWAYQLTTDTNKKLWAILWNEYSAGTGKVKPNYFTVNLYDKDVTKPSSGTPVATYENQNIPNEEALENLISENFIEDRFDEYGSIEDIKLIKIDNNWTPEGTNSKDSTNEILNALKKLAESNPDSFKTIMEKLEDFASSI